MEIYLPIANLSINIFYILILGIVVGFFSGLLGIGGGIILNPALIKMGIPPIVTVGTSISQMVGATISGFLAHLRLKNIDLRMGWMMVVSGFIGGGIGVILAKYLEELGHFRAVVLSFYAFYLGFIGITMLIDFFTHKEKKSGSFLIKKLKNLPFQVEFQFTKTSILVPVGIGFISGFLAAIMGVGGGFVVIPALMYLANFPVNKAVGMSLFQMIFITSFLTYFHATVNFGVDVILSLLLMAGSSFGAVFGAAVGQKINKKYTKLILALLVSVVSILSFYQLFFEKAKEKVELNISKNIISDFALNHPSEYAIAVIIISLIAGIIISTITHRLKLLIEIYLEKQKIKKESH